MQCWGGRAPKKKKQGCRTAAYQGGESVDLSTRYMRWGNTLATSRGSSPTLQHPCACIRCQAPTAGRDMSVFALRDTASPVAACIACVFPVVYCIRLIPAAVYVWTVAEVVLVAVELSRVEQ
jgi:hypothetical protein